MNKAELVDAMSAHSGLTKKQSKEALEGFIGAVSGSLKSGDRVALVGFGSFSVNHRAARKGRNPRTKAEMVIPAKKVVKFKPGNELSDFII